MGESQLIGQIASTGIVGVFLVLAILALRAKDAELSLEKSARIKDSQDFLQLAMNLQGQVILAVNKLSEMVESWERREQERERIEAAAQSLKERAR